jgi:FlgD Ig-like domain/FG-GAP-like repeat
MKTRLLIFASVFLVCTAAAQQPLKTIMEVEYVNSNYALGTGMLGLGDINNDGKPDFAVSAGNIGMTFIYFGGKGVLDTIPDIKIKGGGQMAKGDLNGDGKMDLVVAGRETLYVYYGKTPTPIAIDTIPDLIITGEGSTDGFANSFAIGDLNHDGFDDLVVSYSSYGPPLQGKCYIFLGRTQPTSIADYSVVGDSVGYYGFNVAIADINGDGISDLAVSAVHFSEVDYETIDIYYGHNGWTFDKDYNQRIDSRMGNFQNLSSFNLVDVNADGKADISFSYLDSAYFFYGRSDSVHHIPDLILNNPDTTFYQTFVGPAFGIGDINNDGKPDFALRASPGGGGMCLLVYLGNLLPGPKDVGERCKSFVGGGAFSPIVPLGDVNGDGINDFGTVAPSDALGTPPQDGYFIIFSGDTKLVTSVKQKEQTEYTFSLSQNYPNPFNPSTTIEYSLEKQDNIKISIYDITGKLVRVLFEGLQSAGRHRITWDGRSTGNKTVSSGTYFLAAETASNKTLLTKKIVLVK